MLINIIGKMKFNNQFSQNKTNIEKNKSKLLLWLHTYNVINNNLYTMYFQRSKF